jgi:hypothetical protein
MLVVITVFAIWRVTHMLQDEEGPFGVFSRLQAWAASRPDKVGGINHGYFCFYCLSMWVALIPALVLTEGMLSFWVYWFGLSAGAVLVNLIHNKLEQ